MQCSSPHTHTGSVKPHPDSRQCPIHKARVRIEDVLVELRERRVKVGRVPEFHGEAVHLRVCVSKCGFWWESSFLQWDSWAYLVRAALRPEPTECIVVARTGCGIQSHGLHCLVGAAAYCFHCHGCQLLLLCDTTHQINRGGTYSLPRSSLPRS